MTGGEGKALRLVVHDPTDRPNPRAWLGALKGTLGLPTDGTSGLSAGLSPAWWAGGLLHRVAGAADATFAARSWGEALDWATGTSERLGRPIGSLQAWGHGGWGFMRLGESRLDEAALREDHALADRLDALRARLEGPESLVWLRCCSAFGGDVGRRFAARAADRLGCRVGGHTYVIGVFQSGTHVVRPGEVPAWDRLEGLSLDARGEPIGARWSAPGEPSTISCLTLDAPADAG